MSSAVYLASSDRAPGLVKIGFSTSPEARVREIVDPGMRRGCKLLRVVERSRDMQPVERQAHRIMRERRVSCEWFEATEQEALWAVLSAERDMVRHDRRVARYLRSGPPEPRALDLKSLRELAGKANRK